MKARTALVAIVSMTLLGFLATPAVAIVGGEEVSEPWAAALIAPNDGSPVTVRTYCSGFLIKPQWVLTAAHCFDDPRDERGDTVTIGRGLLTSISGEKRTIKDVRKMYNYTAYCPTNSTVLCDIALVELDQASTQPDLNLADAQVLSEWGEGTAARVYGYGVESADAVFTSDHLKRGHVHIDDLRQNHYTLFASGSGTAACYGDSGGPLIVSTSQGPRVVGVVRAIVSSDPTPCTPGDVQSYVKVGWRGLTSNSEPFEWITHQI